MKAYQIYFIFLKILIVCQIIMVFLKKQTKNSDVYIITDTAFKLSAGLYLILFFLIHHFPGLEFEDTVILRFSGVIILFDIDYTGFLKVFAKYSPWLSKKLSFLEAIKG
jgi:hypothetical protein